VRQAQILLKADAEGSNWTDRQIVEAFGCRLETVENRRQRLVELGFEVALNGAKRSRPPIEKRLDEEQEAQIIAMRLGSPPAGYAHESLRLLTRQGVERGLVESVSHETVR
jgi:hypothetical protein